MLGSGKIHLAEYGKTMTKLNVTRRSAITGLGCASMIAIANATSSYAASSLQDFGSQLQTLPEITVYTARRVITMEDNDPAINAVAVVGDRILAAGPLDTLVDRIGSQPFRLDDQFSEKVIITGLIDQHVHPFLAGLTLTSEIISIEDWNIPTGLSKAAVDEADYKSRLQAAEAAMDDPDALLLTWGYHHFFHGEITRISVVRDICGGTNLCSKLLRDQCFGVGRSVRMGLQSLDWSQAKERFRSSALSAKR